MLCKKDNSTKGSITKKVSVTADEQEYKN